MLSLSKQVFTHIRQQDDGTTIERDIPIFHVGNDLLKVELGEDVQVGDVIEDRMGTHVKRMEILDTIPQRFGGLLGAAYNDHLELRYEVRSRAESTPPKHFEVSSLHPAVARIAGDRLRAGQGNDAVLRAFEAIESRIQRLTSRTEIGESLVNTVFKQHDPAGSLLDVSGEDLEESRRGYERNGYRFLFMGAAIGIRNTHAHGSRPEIAPTEAFELLTLASHLMRRLDLAESRLNS
ncbi:TIGR02391 family protein [Nocardia nova]|uniref:TIGR02391 family protein n=1 Tax=Nocardia nova TaxID=37330 RepID=UPI000CEA70B1|nr:TIGR02391 family protein [Nocardia nova]PPJ05432.1 TIGR02391 family protein [Nocardia nova]